MRYLTLLLLIPGLALAETTPIPVTTLPLESIWLQSQHSAPAEVVALNQSRLAAEISARIETIHVRTGERVKAGAPLVSLDCRDHRARLRQQQAEQERLQAQKQQAEQRLRRARNLVQQKNIAEEEIEARDTELDSINAQIRSQSAAIEQQQINVERCLLKAPFTGQVIERLAAEAELASPGTPLIELLQLDQVELEAEVRPQTLEADDDGETVFRYLERDYPVRLSRRFARINPRTGTVRLRLQFTGETPPPGAAGRLLRRQLAHQLPGDYLQRRDDHLGVFLLADDKARFHPLSDAVEGRPAAIDLPADTPIIDQGRHALNDGDAVQRATD